MPEITNTPDDLSLLALGTAFKIEVIGIAPAAALRHLVVTVGGVVTIYEYNNGVITTAPDVVQTTNAQPTFLSVTLMPTNGGTSGAVLELTMTYEDSLSSAPDAAVTYSYGNVTVTGRSPVPDAPDVLPSSLVSVSGTISANQEFVDVQFLLNNEPVFNITAFGQSYRRPNYSGTLYTSPALFAFTVQPRRTWPDDFVVRAEALVRVSPDNERKFMARFPYAFHVTKTPTPVRDTRLVQSRLDRPFPVAVVEIMRTATITALRPPTSAAPTLTIFFYAVERSGLASMLKPLDPQGALAFEASRLLPRDVASPIEAATALSGVDVLWVSYLKELIEFRVISVEQAALLDRAWLAGDPCNRVAAAAMSLLVVTSRFA